MDALARSVFGLLDFAWARVRGRLDGVTDDEYLWRPVGRTWSVVPADGRVEVEREQPPPDPEPLATIAWLTWHIGSETLDGYTQRQFGERAIALAPREWFPTVAGALDALDREWELFRARFGSIEPPVLAAPLGPSWGVWADATPADTLQHVADEVIHHGAQIAQLRDLYRLRGI